MPCHTYGDCNLIVVVNYNITLKTLKRRVLHWLQISSHWWLVLGRVTCICTEEKGFGPWKYWGVSFHECCPSHFKERPTTPYLFTDTFTPLLYHAYWLSPLWYWWVGYYSCSSFSLHHQPSYPPDINQNKWYPADLPKILINFKFD